MRAANDERFRQLASCYDADPADFATAWAYLQHHPVFHRPLWPRHPGRTVADMSPEELTGPPEFVEDCDGLSAMWMYVTREDERTTLIHLEHGPHLWPKDIPESEHWRTPVGGIASHDPSLDVTAPTYEEATVALAARVRARYGHDRTRV